MLLELILIYAVFVVFTIIINYYSNLIIEKDEYTKDDLKKALSYTQNVMEVILKRYSLPAFLISSFVAIILTRISSFWILNSSLIFIVFFIVLPQLKRFLVKFQVADSETFRDVIINILINYNILIILGYGFGTGCALIYAWAATKTISFLWFLLNLTIVVILLNVKLRKLMEK